MKVLRVEDIRAADQHTIKNEPISSLDLMERAAGKCVDWLGENIIWNDQTAHIVCGMGNNGGDGLVIARRLHQLNQKVKVYILRFTDKGSPDFESNLQAIQELDIHTTDINSSDIDWEIKPWDVLIDAVFGSGLNKAVDGWLGEVFEELNNISCTKIAIDIPSGLFGDSNVENDFASVLKADVTLTFQLPKIAMLLPESGGFCGNWEVLNIGLDQEFIATSKTNFETIDERSIISQLLDRDKFSHKNSFGHSLICAGSKGKMGAAVLAVNSSLRSGAGLTTSVVPECGYEIIQSSAPEAMCHIGGENCLSNLPDDLPDIVTLGIGPGLGEDEKTVDFFKQMLSYQSKPLALDADALNIISNHPEMWNRVPANSILTPHPGEFRRMIGHWENDEERLMMQRKFSEDSALIVVLKGSHTSVSLPNGKVYFNTTGNPGMASAGSGDVLLGLITGLLARGYSPEQSALMGVYVHGMAGDYAAYDKSEESMTAGDIIEHIPYVFKYLYSL